MSIFAWCGKEKDSGHYSLRKHMKSAVPAMLAILLALTMICPSYAQEKQTLRVAMWGEYMPLHGFVEGKAVGFEADIANLIGKNMNRQVVFVDTRAKGMSSIEAVAQGEADIALNAITPTPEREQLVGFTKPYVTLHYRVLSKPGNQLTSVQDLKNSKVVAPEGPALVALRGLVGDSALSTPSLRAAIDLLKKSEVDFVFGEEVGLIASGQGTDFILSGPSLGKSVIAAAVPKNQVYRYNEILFYNPDFLHGLVRKWQPSIDPEESDGVAISPEPRVKDEELRQFEQSFKQAIKSYGINVPITELERRVVDCSIAGASYPSRRCKEALKRTQDAWNEAWPIVLRVEPEDGGKRYTSILYGANVGDFSVGIGPALCTEIDQPKPIIKTPRKLKESDGFRCSQGDGSAWTAHTRRGPVRATLDSLNLEPYEDFEGSSSIKLVAYFQVEQQREPLFISTMPLRVGSGAYYIEAGKQRIEQNAIPESVRRSFRERILRTSDWIDKAWNAYRVPGSDSEGIAFVVSESFHKRKSAKKERKGATKEPPVVEKDLIIALVHWAANGKVDLLYRQDYLPSVYGDAFYCGYPDLTIDGFFDFDGDGDLDVVLNNTNPKASAPYFLLRVDGGFRAREFKNRAPCAL